MEKYIKYVLSQLFLDNQDKILINFISENSTVIYFLEINRDKTDWYIFKNSTCIHTLEINKNKIEWVFFLKIIHLLTF